MRVEIIIKEPNDSRKYHDIQNDIFVGISRLRKKIKKKYNSMISYEIF